MIKIFINLPEDESKIISEFLGTSFQYTDKNPDFTIIGIDQLNIDLKNPHKTIVLSDKDDEFNINQIYQFKIRHLIGKNDKRYLDEILFTLNKDFSGIPTLFEVSTSNDLDQVISDYVEKFDFTNYFTSPKDYLRFILNEMLTNALYKAPRLWWKANKITIPMRRDVVDISPHKIRVKFQNNDSGITLGVVDPFGAASFDEISHAIYRGMKEKTPMDKPDGAGLGLYLSYQHSNQLIFSLEKGKSTEVISIIEKNKRFIKYQSRIRSFHFFEEDET